MWAGINVSMRDTTLDKETLLRTIGDPGVGGTHGREAAKARLEAALVEEVNGRLDKLSGDMSALASEIKDTREAMNRSSREMATLTSALVRWTRVSVFAISLYTVLTGVLVFLQVRSAFHRGSTGEPARRVLSRATPGSSIDQKPAGISLPGPPAQKR